MERHKIIEINVYFLMTCLSFGSFLLCTYYKCVIFPPPLQFSYFFFWKYFLSATALTCSLLCFFFGRIRFLMMTYILTLEVIYGKKRSTSPEDNWSQKKSLFKKRKRFRLWHETDTYWHVLVVFPFNPLLKHLFDGGRAVCGTAALVKVEDHH